MKQIEIRDLAKLATVTEYADMCNLNRNSIHTRINRQKNPLPHVKVDAEALRAQLLESGKAEKMKADRPKFWKGLVQAVSRTTALVMIDWKENPPRREHTGRKIAVRKQIGPAVQQAQQDALAAGFELIPKRHGYRIKKKSDPSFIEHVDNLPQFRDFLKQQKQNAELAKAQ